MARKNSALAVKRIKVKAQTIEYARNAQTQLEYQLAHSIYTDHTSLILAWCETNKVTVCKPAKYNTPGKRGNAMLGDATAGRAYLTSGRRHVYSR